MGLDFQKNEVASLVEESFRWVLLHVGWLILQEGNTWEILTSSESAGEWARGFGSVGFRVLKRVQMPVPRGL